MVDPPYAPLLYEKALPRKRGVISTIASVANLNHKPEAHLFIYLVFERSRIKRLNLVNEFHSFVKIPDLSSECAL
jgi:hypothetical protein